MKLSSTISTVDKKASDGNSFRGSILCFAVYTHLVLLSCFDRKVNNMLLSCFDRKVNKTRNEAASRRPKIFHVNCR